MQRVCRTKSGDNKRKNSELNLSCVLTRPISLRLVSVYSLEHTISRVMFWLLASIVYISCY